MQGLKVLQIGSYTLDIAFSIGVFSIVFQHFKPPYTFNSIIEIMNIHMYVRIIACK